MPRRSSRQRHGSRLWGAVAGAVIVVIVVVVVALQVSGGSSSDDHSTTTPQASGVAATVPVSRAGVTPTSIKVGALITELGSAGKAGIKVESFSAKEQKANMQAFVDAINAKGGIDGRTIKLVFQSYDPLSEDSMHAACLSLTEDAKVFAVLSAGGFYGPSVLCIAHDHHTLYIDSGGITSQDYLQESSGLIFSAFESTDRALATTVRYVNNAGFLKGHTIGVLHSNYPTDESAFEHGLKPALARNGVPTPVVQTLSSDTNTAASQIPLAVTAMRNANVDVVFLAVNTLYAPQFVQAADAQGYHPQYILSDQGGAASNDIAAGAMPPSFRGLSLTSHRLNEDKAGLPMPAAATACLQTYASATGTHLARDDSATGGVLAACTAVKIFQVGTEAAGKQLTTRTFSEGLSSAPPFSVAQFGGTLSFRNGGDGAASFRPQTWKASCKCWMPSGAFQQLTP